MGTLVYMSYRTSYRGNLGRRVVNTVLEIKLDIIKFSVIVELWTIVRCYMYMLFYLSNRILA